MAKKPRLSGSELYHHIYNRGNDRHPLFKTEVDYRQYLEYLRMYSRNYFVDVIAYALMEWHIHLFIFDLLGRISSFINVLHGRYVNYLNRVHHRIGHGFGSRFQNKIVDANNYGLWLSRYIHRQPVEAGLVLHPEDYKWTSYLAYIGDAESDFLRCGVILKQFGDEPSEQWRNYREFVEGIDEGPVDWKAIGMESAVIIGDDSFKAQVCAKLCKPKTNFEALSEMSQDPIAIVCRELNTNRDKLIRPQGWEAKRLRRKAFSILVNKYFLPTSVVARVFEVSPAAVIKAIRLKK